MILSDSFGESYSLCKSFILESGKPQHMTLEPGNCYEEELQRIAEKSPKKTSTKSSSASKKTTSTTANPLETAEASNRHIPLERNASSWRPMTRISTANATAVDETNEAEPTIELNLGEVLMLGLRKQISSSSNDVNEEKRSFSNESSRKQNDEQIDRSSSNDAEQLRERRGEKELGTRTSSTQSDEDISANGSNESGKFVTVQLFQYRLGDVFERAEKYARNTLFPLLSEQISNIFNFESAEGDGSSGRGDESSTDSPIVIKSKSLKRYDEQTQKIDLKSLETMGIQVSAEDTRQPPIEKVQRKRNFDPDQSTSLELAKESSAAVYIDLPTYRPETVKNFIPLIRNSQNDRNR